MKNAASSRMAPKIIIFSGAPSYESIAHSRTPLLDEAQASVIGFPSLPESINATKKSAEEESSLPVAWRSLPLERKHLSTGFSQTPRVGARGDHATPAAQFFTLADLSNITASQATQDSSVASLDALEDVVSQLYDQSTSLLDTTDGTNKAAELLGQSFTDSTGTGSFDATTTSFASTSTDDRSGLSDHPRAPLGPAAASWHLSDLEDIPGAGYLASIRPQTVSVNLIVGIAVIGEPREVHTRPRWTTRSTTTVGSDTSGAAVSLVEITVGDDTRAGFAVTLWLSSARARALASTLRRGDVVLMLNVGLNVFRDKVYGQSLRNDATKIHLLYRHGAGSGDAGEVVRGHYSLGNLRRAGEMHPQLEKTRRVWDWVLRFVNVGSDGPEDKERRAKKRDGRLRDVKSWDRPPDDTQ